MHSESACSIDQPAFLASAAILSTTVLLTGAFLAIRNWMKSAHTWSDTWAG